METIKKYATIAFYRFWRTFLYTFSGMVAGTGFIAPTNLTEIKSYLFFLMWAVIGAFFATIDRLIRELGKNDTLPNAK